MARFHEPEHTPRTDVNRGATYNPHETRGHRPLRSWMGSMLDHAALFGGESRLVAEERAAAREQRAAESAALVAARSVARAAEKAEREARGEAERQARRQAAEAARHAVNVARIAEREAARAAKLAEPVVEVAATVAAPVAAAPAAPKPSKVERSAARKAEKQATATAVGEWQSAAATLVGAEQRRADRAVKVAAQAAWLATVQADRPLPEATRLEALVAIRLLRSASDADAVAELLNALMPDGWHRSIETLYDGAVNRVANVRRAA
jgi:hypothetical protein